MLLLTPYTIKVSVSIADPHLLVTVPDPILANSMTHSDVTEIREIVVGHLVLFVVHPTPS